MKVLVTGGRKNDSDYFVDLVARTLDEIHKEKEITLLIEGGAAGIDTLAREWSEINEVDTLTCWAKWKRKGRIAGPVRNTHMLTYKPDLVVAFPGNSGTRDMVSKAKMAQVPVRIIRE